VNYCTCAEGRGCRGVWGYAPLEHFENLGLLECISWNAFPALCGSRKYPYRPPPRRELEIPDVDGFAGE